MVIIFIIQIPLPLTTTQTDQFVEIAKSKKYSALDKYSTVPEKMMSAKLASVSLLHYTVGGCLWFVFAVRKLFLFPQ